MHFIEVHGRMVNLDLVTEAYWTDAEEPVGLKPVPKRVRKLRVWYTGGYGRFDMGRYTDFPDGPEARSLWDYLFTHQYGPPPSVDPGPTPGPTGDSDDPFF